MSEKSTFPGGLPPLPEVPPGYSHWEYRGTGWKSPKCPLVAWCRVDTVAWNVSKHGANSVSDLHYIEAIPATPASSGEADDARWLPIETAPKDGTRLILFAYDLVTIGHWEDRAGHPGGGPDYRHVWVDEDNGYPMDEPTHWQPLPKPPVSALITAEGKEGA